MVEIGEKQECRLWVSTKDNFSNLNSGIFCVLYLKNETSMKSHISVFFPYIFRIKKRKFCLNMPVEYYRHNN